MSNELARELTQIEAAIAAMAEAVETRVAVALEAWFVWDADLARSIRQADDEIDRMDVEIEERCMQLLALHQPVASDLRGVLAGLRIITNLERAADLARSIAKRVIKLSQLPEPSMSGEPARDDVLGGVLDAEDFSMGASKPAESLRVAPPDAIPAMGDGVLEMLGQVMQAYREGDVELARNVRRRDLHIDQLNRTVFRWAVEGSQGNPRATEAYFSTIVMARALERIGDTAANIAEDVIFAVGGSIVRHSPI